MSDSKPFAAEMPEVDVITETFEADDLEESQGLPFGGVPIRTPSGDTPERVRFSAPAVLSFDGYEETFEVAILNLAAGGVACTGPRGLATRDRLRLAFRLNLTAQPRSFLCEVVWVQAGDNDEASYGLRFLDLNPELALHVLDTVRERAEGRASEWAMPIMPDEAPEPVAEQAPVPPTPRRSWPQLSLAASAGMAAGIGLCLLIAAAGVARNEAAAPIAQRVAEKPVPAIPLKPVVPAQTAQSSDGVVPAQPDTVANEAAQPNPSAPSKAEAAAHQAEQQAVVAAVAKASAPAKVQEAAKPSTFLSRPEGLSLEIAPGGDKAVLRLPLSGPPIEREVFWLNNPTRLVVDVAERQSVLTHTAYELDSSIVSRVRVGQHPGKVRFVIETGTTVDFKVNAEPDGDALRLELVSSR